MDTFASFRQSDPPTQTYRRKHGRSKWSEHRKQKFIRTPKVYPFMRDSKQTFAPLAYASEREGGGGCTRVQICISPNGYCRQIFVSQAIQQVYAASPSAFTLTIRQSVIPVKTKTEI